MAGHAAAINYCMMIMQRVEVDVTSTSSKDPCITIQTCLNLWTLLFSKSRVEIQFEQSVYRYHGTSQP